MSSKVGGIARAPVWGANPFLQVRIIIIIIIIFTGLRERDKREKSEEKIDCHHQDSNQGPSLVASDALTTELWCSRHPSRGRSTFSSDFIIYFYIFIYLLQHLIAQ